MKKPCKKSCVNYFEGIFDTLAGIDTKLDTVIKNPFTVGDVLLCCTCGKCPSRRVIEYKKSPGCTGVIVFCQSASPCSGALSRTLKLF